MTCGRVRGTAGRTAAVRLCVWLWERLRLTAVCPSRHEVLTDCGRTAFEGGLSPHRVARVPVPSHTWRWGWETAPSCAEGEARPPGASPSLVRKGTLGHGPTF